MKPESIFTRDLLDRALSGSGLLISGEASALEKGRDRLRYLRKCNRAKYGRLLFTYNKAGTWLKIINTEKKLEELENIFS